MSTLTQNERQALNDIFMSMTKKENFIAKLKNVSKEFKYLILLILKNKKRIKISPKKS
ncbi:MAG: hypothetical protein J0647_01895 [Campylobacteraceae bacterium]|nr:hypothetical protein [Campylobacteraceae bacterium]